MTTSNTFGAWRRVFVLLALCGIVAACSSGPRVAGRTVPVPKDHGLYALGRDDKLQRLDGGRDWEVSTWGERSDLSPYIEFVISHPAIARHGARPGVVELRKVAWVRSEVSGSGVVAPISGSSWAEPDLPEFQVPLEIVPLERQGNMAYVKPRHTLAPGLYTLIVKDGPVQISSRIGIQWSTVDRNRYSGEHCVDRYSTGGVFYRRCADQQRGVQQTSAAPPPGATLQPTPSGSPLRLYLVRPEQQILNGQPALVVRGVIVNTSNERQPLPPLEARLTDGSGATLQQWTFEAGVNELAPQQSVSFRTETQQLPTSVSKVNVNFASAGGRNLGATR